jgi:hypothetical protein
MAQCSKCGTSMEEDEARELHGQVLCEDCYLDGVNPPKACDPWAVHTAKSFGAQGRQQLSEHQEKILALLREHGPLKANEVTARLGITEAEFRSAFATLRHMELARGCKKGEDIYYTLFSS